MVDLISLIGLIATATTSIGFLPQVIKTWKSKKARDISLTMIGLYLIGTGSWFIYGFMKNDLFIIAANGTGQAPADVITSMIVPQLVIIRGQQLTAAAQAQAATYAPLVAFQQAQVAKQSAIAAQQASPSQLMPSPSQLMPTQKIGP